MSDSVKNNPRNTCGIKWLLVGAMLALLGVWVYKGDEAQRYTDKATKKVNGWFSENVIKTCRDWSTGDDKTPPAHAVIKPVVPLNQSVAQLVVSPCCPECCVTQPHFPGYLYGRNDAVLTPSVATVSSVAAPSTMAESDAQTREEKGTATTDVTPQGTNLTPQAIPVVEQTSPTIALAKLPEIPVISKDMIRARNWAAEKKYALAVIAYKKYITDYPDDSSGYGELGNVYLLSRAFVPAAESYYKAANLMLDAGMIESVKPLMPVIAQYQPQLAVQLKTKIAQKGRYYE
jgi:hypothetical protein